MATKAIVGNGKEYDLNVYLNANLKTTTSIYKAVIMDPTSASDLMVKVVNGSATSTEANFPIGIMQTVNTSGSEVGVLRTNGTSKAIAGNAISAGDFVTVANVTAGATTAGAVIPHAFADASAGAALVRRGILGRALTSATATGQYVTILVMPSMVAQ